LAVLAGGGERIDEFQYSVLNNYSFCGDASRAGTGELAGGKLL